MRRLRPLLVAIFAVLALAVPAVAGAATRAEPPNQNDPCSDLGRNTCGTNGVGTYETYRYGLRWFGDFRGAIPGEGNAFCIDLRFWYPSASYRFREVAAGPLVNRDGETVPLAKRQKLAYAVWAYGRSGNRTQQAATMLYVHSLMGDGAPGEVDPSALGPAVVRAFKRISRDADRYRGPYRLELKVGSGLVVGRQATATVRVLAASGAAVPGVAVELAGAGASGLKRTVETGAQGLARVTFTPTSAGAVELTATTSDVASTLPRIFAPTTAAAARNGQRLVVPASQRLTASASAPAAPATLTVTTAATPQSVLVGEPVTDAITLAGALPSYRATIAARVYGPFRTREQIACTGTPVWTGTVAASGPGTFSTEPFTPTAPGWYVYQEDVPGDASHTGLTTPCDDPAERFQAQVQPTVVTIVSQQLAAPGTAIFDRVQVSGTGGERVTVAAALYGPFPSVDALRCDGPPFWTGTIDVPRDGEYRTASVTLTTPGYYTYQERIAASDVVREVVTPCGEAAETTLVSGSPQVRTQVSAQETTPGSTITDDVIVTGLGALAATVGVELWGPFDSLDAISCTGTPYWTGSFVATGDGTYTTEPVTLELAGYYTYREALLPGPGNPGVTTACGEASETTVARATPAVTTLTSAEVARPGAVISDRIAVTGLGRTPARVVVELFGPFPTRAAMRCTGAPLAREELEVAGDGTYRSPTVELPRAGFYTWREILTSGPNVTPTTTECGLSEETTLGAPLILTGRGDRVTEVVAGQGAGSATPTRVRIPTLDVDAPVSAVGIDLAAGALAVPTNVRRTAWWQDGAAPGDEEGAVLIAGHVDSAAAGEGAFFSLKGIRRGARIEVATRGGDVVRYRVTSVKRVRKAALPTSVYSRQGDARLVLVTCGGPFDRAAGSYRDNVVVTAVPLG
ncbi:MAG: sortase [Thermoleophilia bacterium]